jgi:serine/threonine-protein kinase
MPPEQILGQGLTRRSDIYAAGIVLWEALAGRRLFHGASEGEVVYLALESKIEPPSRYGRVPAGVERAILKALDRDPDKRFATADEFGAALEKATAIASAREVGEWVRRVAPATLASRARRVEAIESAASEAIAALEPDVRSKRASMPTLSAVLPEPPSPAAPDAAAPAATPSTAPPPPPVIEAPPSVDPRAADEVVTVAERPRRARRFWMAVLPFVLVCLGIIAWAAASSDPPPIATRAPPTAAARAAPPPAAVTTITTASTYAAPHVEIAEPDVEDDTPAASAFPSPLPWAGGRQASPPRSTPKSRRPEDLLGRD